MKEPHYGHAGTVYDGKMYISGGITHDSFQKELLCYDPTVDDWETKNPMTGSPQFIFVLFSNILFSRSRASLYDNASRPSVRFWREPFPRQLW